MTKEALPPSGTGLPDGNPHQLPSSNSIPNGLGSDKALEPIQREVVKGDDGKALAINLTPEQAKAGRDALDAVLLHPDIHPDTPISQAISVLTEQIPIVEERTNAMEVARKEAALVRRKRRNLAIKGGAIVAAAAISVVTLPPVLGSIETFLAESTASSIAAEEAKMLGGSRGLVSLPSQENWRLRYLPEEPNTRFIELEGKSQRVGYSETIKIDGKDTGISASAYRLYRGGVVPQLNIKDKGNNLRPVHLPIDPLPGVDTRAVIFENVADGTQRYFLVKIMGVLNSATLRLELKEMQKVSPSESANR